MFAMTSFSHGNPYLSATLSSTFKTGPEFTHLYPLLNHHSDLSHSHFLLEGHKKPLPAVFALTPLFFFPQNSSWNDPLKKCHFSNYASNVSPPDSE